MDFDYGLPLPISGRIHPASPLRFREPQQFDIRVLTQNRRRVARPQRGLTGVPAIRTAHVQKPADCRQKQPVAGVHRSRAGPITSATANRQNHAPSILCGISGLRQHRGKRGAQFDMGNPR